MTGPMDLVHATYVPPGKGPFPTLIALHGWGANALDLLGLGPIFANAGWLTLCPQGATELQVAPGTPGYGWFPLVRGQPPDPRAFLKGSAQLRAFVEGVPERYPVDPRRTVILGFSQGGLMGFDLVLRQPERFAGLVSIASWLPEILAANLPELPAQRGFPVLQIHGTDDPQVDVARARESRGLLEGFGVDLTWEEYPMGHEIRPEALRKILDWLGEKVSRSQG